MGVVDEENLNAVMEFGHVIEVKPDGDVVDGPNLYTDELVWQDVDEGGSAVGEPTVDKNWELLTGYSGQHGYSGPCMHPSEFIDGKMARDILASPGVYVALSVECRYPDERWHITSTNSSTIVETVTAPSAQGALEQWCQRNSTAPAGYEATSADGDYEEPAGWCVARFLG